MKKNFKRNAKHLVAGIFTIAMIAALMLLPAATTKSEAAQTKMNFSEKQDSQKVKLPRFRAFLGDTSLQAQPSGAYYTVEFSYLPNINHWQVDGVYDFYGNPVTFTVTGGSAMWYGTYAQLVFSGLAIDLSVASGTDHINESFTLQMY